MKMSKSIARKRLLEAKNKIARVFAAGHLTGKAFVSLDESIDRHIKRLKK